MATPFREIYERAIFKFSDYQILKLDFESREDVLQTHLISAKTAFRKICKNDLDDCDFRTKQFNQTLDEEVIEILALGIAYCWVSFKALNSELLKNILSSKDYYYHSPANLLKEIQALRKELKLEFRSRMRQYSYNDNEISTLKP